jgi:VanZ family protein
LNFREIVKAWLPVVLWMALMFFGSTDLMSAEQTSRFVTPFLRWLQPGISADAIAHVHFLVRKTAHLTEYAMLAGLLFRALRGWIGRFWLRAAAAFAPTLAIAAADEFHQSFVPSRTPSLGDVFIDYAGAVVGIVICRIVHQALLHRRSSG